LDKLISDEVRRKVLTKITPTKVELDNQREVISTLKESLIQHSESTDFQYSFIEPQGSTGRKQTQLRGAADIDLFVGLNPADYSDILELPLQQRHSSIDHLMTRLVSDWFTPAVSGLDVSNVQKTYSQHPYLSLQVKGLEVDILGCFDINPVKLSEEGPFTAVDRTVHHTRHIADNLKEETRENARILKSFVRSCHAYADRCAVGRMGLTGVALELQAILSSNIEKAFYALEHLDENPIDPEGRSLAELRKIPTFRNNHVFLIDPTDHRRNIAASFTPRSYRWVKHRIGDLRKVSKDGNTKAVLDMLIETPISTEALPNWLVKHTVVHEFKSDGSTHYTILRDKLYRIASKIQALLMTERTGEPRFGMTLAEVYFESDRYAVGIIIENPEISEHYIRRGPPTDLIEASKEFRKTHPKAIAEDGFLWVTEKRPWTSAAALIEKTLQKNPINGLELPKMSNVSRKVLNVLYKFILPIEQEILQKITRVKDRDPERTE
jgi:tRNA nucleotidyltransferase (CCA-adding enzyme)